MTSLWAAGFAALLVAASPARRTTIWRGWPPRWTTAADGRWTEESWTPPRGGVMLGHSRSGLGETLREFEFLRLQAGADGVPVYLAQPGGAAPVEFRLVRHGAASATFENAAHDYPQRIDYVRDEHRRSLDDLADRRASRPARAHGPSRLRRLAHRAMASRRLHSRSWSGTDGNVSAKAPPSALRAATSPCLRHREDISPSGGRATRPRPSMRCRRGAWRRWESAASRTGRNGRSSRR